ncbi:hypothetical protein NG799_07175 [Laspinema sp. D1]|uniref:Trypsin-co-occurring domain-containing protein n=1 Tax=Laspinema palackyanum D2a TaxID=2953684 RepID=A0ABT2MRD9_9CYAN|nr:hypothetical protein [Laspinema sp. D2a]
MMSRAGMGIRAGCGFDGEEALSNRPDGFTIVEPQEQRKHLGFRFLGVAGTTPAVNPQVGCHSLSSNLPSHHSLGGVSMSTKITEILGPDGEKIYIQYDDEDSDELQAVGYIDDIKERTEKLKTLMVSTVQGYSQIVLDAVKQGMSHPAPSKVTLEFGLQAGGETGVPFVTKGSAQANVKVTIEWELNGIKTP